MIPFLDLAAQRDALKPDLLEAIERIVDSNQYVLGEAVAQFEDARTQHVERKYNTAWVFKRAQGEGNIQRVEGLGPLLQELGPSIVHLDLLPVGAPRRNWEQTLVGDGIVILRHPDLQTLLDMADRVGTELQMYAG